MLLWLNYDNSFHVETTTICLYIYINNLFQGGLSMKDQLLKFGIDDYKTAKYLMHLWKTKYGSMTTYRDIDFLTMYGFDPSRITYLILNLHEGDIVYFTSKLTKPVILPFEAVEKHFYRLTKEGFKISLSKDNMSLILNKDNFERTFKVPLSDNLASIDPYVELDIFKEDYCTFEIDSKSLLLILKDIDSVTDYIRISADTKKQKIYIGSKVVSFDSTEYNNNFSNYSINQLKKDVEVCYCLDYLIAFLQHIPSDLVTISFGNEQPMRLDCMLMGYSRVTCYIAPRIEEFDNEID